MTQDSPFLKKLKAIGGIVCAFALTLLLQCSHSITVAGGSTTTDNAKVLGKAVYATGLPAKGASVRIRTKDYVRPIGKEPDPVTRHDTTVNDSGWFYIDSLEIGTYRIEINDNATSAAVLACDIVTAKDSIGLPPDTLRGYQAIAGTVDSSLLDKGKLYVQVFGLDRLAPVDSVTGAYAVSNLPPGTFTLRIVSSDTSFTPIVIDTAKTDTTGSSPVIGQWFPANGPYAAKVKCICISPSGDVFIGTDGGGVYRSVDNGATWTQANTGLTNLYIQAIAANPDGTFLYAGTQYGIFRSADRGAGWTAISSSLPSIAMEVQAIVASPNGSGGTGLFAGTKYDGVFISSDNGATWNVVIAGNGLADTTNVLSLAVVPGIVYAGTWADGVFRSNDNGSTWTKVNKGLTDPTIECLGASPDGAVVYAGTPSGVFSSTDNGATWTLHTVPGMFGFINGIAAIGGGATALTLFAASYDAGVFISADSGATWTAVASGLASVYVNTVAAKGTMVLAGADYDGIFVSSNSGVTWTASNTGLTNLNITSLVSSGTDIFAGTVPGVFRSSDNGITWNAANNGPTNIQALVAAPNGLGGSDLFAAPGSGVYLSTDNGVNWTATGGALAGNSVASFAVSGTTVLAGVDKAGSTTHGIFMTNDNGATWTASNAGIGNPDTLGFTAFAVAGAMIFAATDANGVYRSSDNGLNWASVNNGLVARAHSVHALAVSQTEIIAGTEDGLFISSNNGDSWIAANNGLGAYPLVISLAVSPNGKGGYSLFAGLGGGPQFNGVFVSVNNGAAWTSVTSGLPNTLINALLVQGNILYAGTDGCGVWKLQLK